MQTSLLNKIMQSEAGIAAFILRVPVGLVLIAHGAQKLFGWFGGNGLAGTAQWLSSMGMEPGLLMALLAGGAEFFGGLALVLGIVTRPAALVAAFTMLVAIFSVHISNGLFAADGGYEYALVLMVALLALVVQGGGYLSIDKALSEKIGRI
ncbi:MULTISPECIES: DoxX family protein [unclassified Psychrobacter]|uniref:DoxX family protein n=1 Tax=unclassified Psychrobacter TaxID=196806 RepID=UPI0025FA662F|nr:MULTISPECIES: DoxX family protein [unclassified Psychrobacter]